MNARQNPAGLSAMAVTVLIWASSAVGVDLPAEVAAALVGLTAGLVSYLNPRE